jgi:hypothetical protein
MPCCGGKRAALKQQATAPGSNMRRPVRYTGSQTVTLRGRVTGTQYVFSPQQPLQYVDVRDAAYLSEAPKTLSVFSDSV